MPGSLKTAVLLGAVLALGAGILFNQAPPEPSATAGVTAFRERVGPWTVRGSLSPGATGVLQLEFSLLDARGAPPDTSLHPAVTLTMPDHAMPPIAVMPAASGRGSYRSQVSLPMGGRWQMTIRLTAGVAVVNLTADRTLTPAARLWPRLLPSLLAILVAGAFVLLIVKDTGLRSGRRRWPAGAGVAVMVAGVVLGARTILRPASGAGSMDLENPMAATPASVAAGKQVYRRHCQACHGITGAGDGPAAMTLRPRPSDLRIHMAAGHTDGQLYFWITEGFAGTAMPAYKKVLAEEERWHVINFIRTFALADR
jgi:mono/diheme cytochrome c family protein